MSRAAHELLDSGNLAAMRLVDPIGRPILSPVRATAERVRPQVKRLGELIVIAAAGLDAYTASFDMPAAPAVRSIAAVLDILPSEPRCLPRRATLALPRDPAPAKNSAPDPLLRPVEIALLPPPPPSFRVWRQA